MYAVGGFDGQRTCTVVEAYDIRMNHWEDMTPMHSQRLGLGCACV